MSNQRKAGSLTVEVPESTLSAFRVYVNGLDSVEEAVRQTRLNRRTILNLMEDSYCHPYTLQIVQKIVKSKKVA